MASSLEENRAPPLVVVVIVLLCMTWVSFAMRAWVRLRILKAPGIDDLLTFVSLLLFTIYGAFVLYAAHWGTGRHATALSPVALRRALMGWWYCEAFYVWCTAILKCAVGAFILRVATQKTHRFIVWTLIVVNIIFNIYFFFIFLFQCNPPSYFWNRFDPSFHGHCADPRIIANSTYASSALSIITDWVFGILPIFIVWNLKMSKQKRTAVALVLGFGAIASTATIVRVPYLISMVNTEDFLYATVDVAIWSTVEPGIGLTAISIATLRPLFRSRFGLATKDQQYSSSYPRPSKGYIKPNTLPLGVESNNTTTSSGDGMVIKRECRGSTSFLDSESLDRDVEGGMPLSPLSPRAAARLGNSATAWSNNSKEGRGTPTLTEVDELSEPRESMYHAKY